MAKTNDENLEECLLGAWIGLNGLLKDSLMTQGLTYNEAIVMYLVYSNYQAGHEKTSTQELIASTGFLKSLMNRTINALSQQGYLQKHKDGRNLFVSVVEKKLSDFLVIHKHSLDIARSIIEVIGTKDASCFVAMSNKIQRSPIREHLKG